MTEYVKIEKSAFDGFVKKCLYGRMHALMIAVYQKKLGEEQKKFDEKEIEKQKKMRNNDSMTGMMTKAYALQNFAEGITYSERSKKPVSVVITDIDDFKVFNDTHGHPAGDELIKDFAACIQEKIRSWDIWSRYGGDEGLLVLPNADEKQARTIVERGMEYFRDYFADDKKYQNVGFTYGLSTYRPGGFHPDRKSAQDYAGRLIELADNRLRDKKKIKKVGR